LNPDDKFVTSHEVAICKGLYYMLCFLVIITEIV